MGAIQGPEQGALQSAVQLRAGEFQVAPGGGIEHQLIARLPGGGQLQGNGTAGLGVVEIAEQTAGGPQAQGHLAEPKAIQAGQPEALQQCHPRFLGAEGCAGQGREPQGVRTPGGPAFARPQHLRGVHLQQLLVKLIAAIAFGHAEFAGAHIGHRQPPARLLAHHGAEPVVAASAEQPLLEHGARGEHPCDFAFEQGPLGGRGFHLIAEGHAQAAAHQFGAIALGGVMGDARHGHASDRLAALLAGEGELQQARELDGVFKEALKKVAQAVEQHPLGMGGFELHVVAQHRRELFRFHQAVVVPGGQVGVGGLGAWGFWCGVLGGCCWRLLALPRSAVGVFG